MDANTRERVQKDGCPRTVVMLRTRESRGGGLVELLDSAKAGRGNDLDEALLACEGCARSEAADGRYDRQADII